MFFKKNRFIKLFFIIFPISIIGLLILTYGVNIPFSDEWVKEKYLESYLLQNINFSELFLQHNVHRIFFPRLLWLSALFITGEWNFVHHMIISYGIVLFQLFVFYFLIKKLVTEKIISSSLGYIFLLITTFILFSLQQEENWMWGFQTQIFLHTTMTVTALALLAVKTKMPPWFQFTLAIIAAIINTYSFLSGFIIWFLGTLYLLITKKKEKVQIFIWALIGIMATAFYFFNFSTTNSGAPENISIDFILRFGVYILAYLGNPLVFHKIILASVAAILLLFTLLFSTIYIYKNNKKVLLQSIEWPLLAIFSILTAIITGFGRVNFGIVQAQSSRYVTISLFLLLSTILYSGIAYTIYKQKVKHPHHSIIILLSSMSAVCIIAFGYSSYIGYDLIKQKHIAITQAKKCINSPQKENFPSCVRILYPGTPNVIATTFSFFKQHSFGGIEKLPSIKNATIKKSTKTDILSIDISNYDPNTQSIKLAGWGFNQKTKEPLSLVAVIDNEIIATITPNIERNDVAKIHSLDKNKIGWDREIYLIDLSMYGKELFFYKKNQDKTYTKIETNKRILFGTPTD